MTPWEWVKAVCFVTLTVFACLLLWSGRAMVQESRADLKDLHGRTVQAIDKVNSFEDAEKTHLANELKEVQKATAGISDLARHSDFTLNGTKEHPGVLPALALVLQNTNKLVVQETGDIHALSESADTTIKDLQPVILQLGKDADALAVTLNDPNIKVMIGNMAASSADLQAASAELTSMLRHGDATAADIQKVADKVAYEYTKTKNLAYALFKELLTMAGSAATLVK